MIRTCNFTYFDNDRRYHEVVQVWALIPATGVWRIISAKPVEVDPQQAPTCPTRPA